MRRLSDGARRSISGLCAQSPLTRQAITKPLRVLERAGLVASARSGRESRFALKAEAVLAARAYLDAVSAEWDAALLSLKALVEA